MKKSLVCLLILAGLFAVANSASAITTRPPRPNPPVTPPTPMPEPVVSAD